MIVFCQDETIVLQGGSSEVDKQTFGETGGFEVVDDLGFFASGEGLQGFQFDNDVSEANEVRAVDALEFFASISDDEVALTLIWDRRSLKLHL
jgi:hypothetical protein